MMYQLLTGELPFGPLNSERDLVPYINNGKNGRWNRSLLMQTPYGKDWERLIEGCLIPKFQERLQNVEETLRYVPQGHTLSNQPAYEEVPDFQTRIVNGVLLRVMQGEDYGRVYRLDDMLRGYNAILRMGRDDGCTHNDIAITECNSSYVSRRHCTLELDYNIGQWVIRDGQYNPSSTAIAAGMWQRSTNGTFVNSKEVGMEGCPFNPGDIISIGDTKLRAEAY